MVTLEMCSTTLNYGRIVKIEKLQIFFQKKPCKKSNSKNRITYAQTCTNKK